MANISGPADPARPQTNLNPNGYGPDHEQPHPVLDHPTRELPRIESALAGWKRRGIISGVFVFSFDIECPSEQPANQPNDSKYLQGASDHLTTIRDKVEASIARIRSCRLGIGLPIGVNQVHLQRRESDCWRTKSSSLPTFGIDASTDARLRRLGPRNADSKISRCPCSALRLCLAARCFRALTKSSDRFRTTSCATCFPHFSCYQ